MVDQGDDNGQEGNRGKSSLTTGGRVDERPIDTRLRSWVRLFDLKIRRANIARHLLHNSGPTIASALFISRRCQLQPATSSAMICRESLR
jgi:hypothetical protein